MPENDEQASTAMHRRALRVLRMVAELHRDGYQRVRIVPGMSGSGMHWRCDITDRSGISLDHGALLASYGPADPPALAQYSSAQGNDYFGWTDAQQATARDLADLFRQRFPELCEQGRGTDWAYAGWYVYMLGLAAKGAFPIAYEDACAPPPVAYMRTTGKPEWVLLPPARRMPVHGSVCTPDASSGAWTVPRLRLQIELPPANTPSMWMARALAAVQQAGLSEDLQQQIAAEMRAAPDGEALRRVVLRWMHVRVSSAVS